MGTAPGFGASGEAMPDAAALDANTFAAFADMDASPTKTWLIQEGLKTSAYRSFFDAAFARRPGEELYDLKKDPDQVVNVASHVEYANAKTELAERLMSVLQDTLDPRVAEGTSMFDEPPFTDEPEPEAKNRKAPKVGFSWSAWYKRL